MFFWELYTIQVLCFILTSVIYFVYCITLGRKFYLTSILQSTALLGSLVDITWYFTGIEEFKSMVLRNSLIKLLSLVAVYAFVKDVSSLNVYVLIVNCSIVIGHLCVWPRALKDVGLPRFTLANFREHMPNVLKLFVPIMALNIYVLADKLVLGNLGSMTAVGYYENSDKDLLINSRSI